MNRRGAPSGASAFAYRNYRLFWFGQLVSVTGTWMQSLAQSWLIVDTLHANPFQLGLVNVCQFAPVLLLGIRPEWWPIACRSDRCSCAPRSCSASSRS